VEVRGATGALEMLSGIPALQLRFAALDFVTAGCPPQLQLRQRIPGADSNSSCKVNLERGHKAATLINTACVFTLSLAAIIPQRIFAADLPYPLYFVDNYP
jgi:hypothetical protein